MATVGQGSTESIATLLPIHDPPRRSKPKSSYAGLLDLPDEILFEILEHFAAPIVKGPVLRHSYVCVPHASSRSLCWLSRVNKRMHELSLPLIWRHLCDQHYFALFREIDVILRKCIRLSTLTAKLGAIALSLNSVTALSLDWQIDLSYETTRDDLTNPEIIRSCKQLRYLRLELHYSMITSEHYEYDDDGTERLPECRSVLSLRLALLELQYIRHLELKFVLRGEDTPDSTCPVGQYLAEITEVKLNSLEGLTLSGLTELDHEHDSTRADNPRFRGSFNYRSLKMVRFIEEVPKKYIGAILDRLKRKTRIRMLSLSRASTDAVQEVPDAMRRCITFLELQDASELECGLLLSFPALQALSCQVADVSYRNQIFPKSLRKLTLTDTIHTVIGWIEEHLKEATYMPTLRSLYIKIMWSECLEGHCKQVEIRLPDSREITLEVEYEDRPGQ